MSNKQKWIDALRSGQYKQTNGKLHRNSAYCCLGVACDVYNKETGKGEWRPYNDSSTLEFYLEDAKSITKKYLNGLPYEVMEWLGFFPSTFPQSRLIQMNDSAGCSFDEIADFVETYKV